MVNSRAKGANYEREISKLLFEHLGMEFKRDLDQYRSADHGDLLCEDDEFPFVIECKRRVGGSFKLAWMEQAEKAAQRVRKHPCVIYRFNHQPNLVVLKMATVAKAVGGSWQYDKDTLVTMSITAFCCLARELMAYEILEEKPLPCLECEGTGTYEEITWRDFGRGPEPIAKDKTCEECGGTGIKT